MAMAYCGICRHNIRDQAAHAASREHQRNLHPITSRKSSRANARRERRRSQRHTLTKSWEDQMFAEQGPRHFYGAWAPYGWSAIMGGHPGRVVRKVHRKLRKHARRLARAVAS